MIVSGRLTQSLEIHAQTATKNAFGERENTWAKIANGDVRGEVKMLKGDERESRGGQVADNQYQVRMYFHPDMTGDKRLVWQRKTGDMTLDVVRVDNVDERDQELLVLAEEAPRKGAQSR